MGQKSRKEKQGTKAGGEEESLNDFLAGWGQNLKLRYWMMKFVQFRPNS